MKSVEIYCYTVEELAKDHGMPIAEVLECYGEKAEKLYFARCGEVEGSYAGVLNNDGTYDVCGCRRDEEGITFGHMLEVLVGESF